MATSLHVTRVHNPEALRLKEWHEKTHVMHIAHSKAASRNEQRDRGLGVAVAILTTFTASTVFSSLVASTSQGVKVATMATSVTAVIMAAAQTAFAFGKHAAEHQHAAVSYGKLRREMEKWRIEHPADTRPEEAELNAWVEEWKNIEESAPPISDDELGRAEERMSHEYKTLPDPW